VLLDRSLANMAAGPPGDLGMDVDACRAAGPRLHAAFTRWERGGPRPRIAPPPLAPR
jgi:hypothetical protein